MKNTYKVNKEAVKKIAEKVYDNGSTVINRSDLEELFPEIKESEDSRIRKRIIHALHGDVLEMSEIKEAVAWLEKQGEQKSIDDLTQQEAMDIAVAKCFEQGEQKPVFEMKTPEGSLGIDSDTYNKIVDKCVYGEQKPAWSEEDIELLDNTIKFIEDRVAATSPSLRTYSPTLTGKEIPFLKSLKDRVQPHLKQEWSEEDEKQARQIERIVHDDGCTQKLQKQIADWLKSLKERYTWKPSDEQMKALQEAIIEMGKSVSPCSIEEFHEIQSLYCNLKKLTE